jgi:hypothetical protein
MGTTGLSNELLDVPDAPNVMLLMQATPYKEIDGNMRRRQPVWALRAAGPIAH